VALTLEALPLDALDRKVLDHFAGKVVRKDLVGPLKVEYNVPAYVLEYLLGKYCSTDDPKAVQDGLQEVRRTLSENYVRPDAPELFKSQVREAGPRGYRVIDKVRVRLHETEDKYWAELVNLQINHVHIPEELLRRYERVLAGGLWCVVDLEYDPALTDVRGTIRPFAIHQLRPIQLAAVGLDELRSARGRFTRDEWLDFLIRSIGLEPSHFSQRLKLLLLLRLVPFVERNYNLVELGPRNTGKSYVFRELSPYSILVSGGEATVASLFVNLATGRVGMVGLWDVVAFDEVAGLQKLKNPASVQILKDYMESGSFSRGRDEIQANASLVFIGNLNVDVELALRTSHLFTPFPKEMQDLAFLDRVHAYLPGWEIPKMRTEYIGRHYGFVVDYMAELFRSLREIPMAHVIDEEFRLGRSLNKRDEKAVRRTVSGLLKLLHPDGAVSKREMEEYLTLALELRRRVKEQLKRMGGVEFWDTNFTYVDLEYGKEVGVPVPEQSTVGAIPAGPWPSGVVFSASADPASGKAGIFRIEVSVAKGSTGYSVTGLGSRPARDAARAAYEYLRAQWGRLSADRTLEGQQVNIQIVDVRRAESLSPSSMAIAGAIASAVLDRPLVAGTVVMGDLTLQGGIQPVLGLSECLHIVVEEGGRRVLMPAENLREIASVPSEIVRKLELVFYTDPMDAITKALGV